MINRTRIKVCGITDLAEANAIVNLGVDALGFIFAKESPRNIKPEKCRVIVKTLPPLVDVVGVFVNENAAVVNEIIQYCGLTMVQLHGEETPEYCNSISCRIIKVFRLGGKAEMSDYNPYAPYEKIVSGVLLDTLHERVAGGSGEVFDWQLLEQTELLVPLILAGGLSPENIGDAIRRVNPFAVDVNSGVELTAGRKDMVKVKQFVQAVYKADKYRVDFVP